MPINYYKVISDIYCESKLSVVKTKCKSILIVQYLSVRKKEYKKVFIHYLFMQKDMSINQKLMTLIM